MSLEDAVLRLTDVRKIIDQAIDSIEAVLYAPTDAAVSTPEPDAWDAYAAALAGNPLLGWSAGQSSPAPPVSNSPPAVALSGPAFLGAQLGKKGRPRNELDDLVRDYSEEDRAVALAAYREQIPERRRIENEVWQMASIDDGKVHCVRVTNGFVGGFRCTFPADMWSTAAVVEA